MSDGNYNPNPTPKGNRVGLNDSVQTMVLKMVDGNAGATSVLMQILKKNPVDGIFTILYLDDLHVYGSDIWRYYKDVYGQNLDDFIKVVNSRKLPPLGER